MELEGAIKDIEVWLDFPVWFIHTGKDEDFLRRIDKSAIETLLNHLTKQDKMIELMVEHIEMGCDFDNRIQNTSQIKQYFEKKAEEEING